MKSIGLAVLAGSLLVGASGALAEGRQSVALEVSTAGVDFADPASVAEFRRAVARQIEQVCNPGDRINADMKPDFACRQEMAATFEPTLRQLAFRNDQGAPRRN